MDAGASDAEALGIGRHTKSPSKTTPGNARIHGRAFPLDGHTESIYFAYVVNGSEIPCASLCT